MNAQARSSGLSLLHALLLAVAVGANASSAVLHAQEPIQASSASPGAERHASTGAAPTAHDGSAGVSPNSHRGVAPDGGADAMSSWTSGRYRVTPSDVLELQFPYVPEFNQTVAVQPDGYIALRAVGDVRVQGRTVPEVKVLLAEAYENILREPVINIVLREFEKPYFMATGEVARPGKYELRGATTLTQGIALSGGHTGAAKHSQVILFRRVGDWLEVKELNVKKMYSTRRLDEDPLLLPGDTIYVPKSVMSSITPFIPRPGIALYPF